MIKVEKIGKPSLLILIFALFALSILVFLLFLGREKINVEIVEFRNITNQTLLEELFRSYNLDFYPFYAESYMIYYGIGNNKTNWKMAYIVIYVFEDSNKSGRFLNFLENYKTNASTFFVTQLKNNEIMIINFYENIHVNNNYVIEHIVEKFKNR